MRVTRAPFLVLVALGQIQLINILVALSLSLSRHAQRRFTREQLVSLSKDLSAGLDGEALVRTPSPPFVAHESVCGLLWAPYPHVCVGVVDGQMWDVVCE